VRRPGKGLRRRTFHFDAGAVHSWGRFVEPLYVSKALNVFGASNVQSGYLPTTYRRMKPSPLKAVGRRVSSSTWV
jgi:hypothetical protein